MKSGQNPENNYEDTIEGLLKFYELIGKNFEDKENKTPVDEKKSKEIVAEFQKSFVFANSDIPLGPSHKFSIAGDNEALSLQDLFEM